jgi:hypothetical protein
MPNDNFRTFIIAALLLMTWVQLMPGLQPLSGAIATLQLAIKIYYA